MLGIVMSEVAASEIEGREDELEQVVQDYFRHQQKNLKPSNIENLIKNYDFSEERGQASLSRRA
jgi:hypothetical protein